MKYNISFKGELNLDEVKEEAVSKQFNFDMMKIGPELLNEFVKAMKDNKEGKNSS